MDRIESQVNALIRAIQSDERYLRYQTCRKSLENYPELMERIWPFWRRRRKSAACCGASTGPSAIPSTWPFRIKEAGQSERMCAGTGPG